MGSINTINSQWKDLIFTGIYLIWIVNYHDGIRFQSRLYTKVNRSIVELLYIGVQIVPFRPNVAFFLALQALPGQIRSWFQGQDIRLPDGWLEECLEFVKQQEVEESEWRRWDVGLWRKAVFDQWLFADLREFELPSLPSEVASQVKFTLRGNVCVQLMYAVDISSSAYSQLRLMEGTVNENAAVNAEGDFDGPNFQSGSRIRTMMLVLSDGLLEVRAILRHPIPNLETKPGSKLRLRGPIHVRRGVLLLNPENIQPLGGEVESLVEEFAAATVLRDRLPNARQTGSRQDETTRTQNSSSTLNQEPSVSSRSSQRPSTNHIDNERPNNAVNRSDAIGGHSRPYEAAPTRHRPTNEAPRNLKEESSTVPARALNGPSGDWGLTSRPSNPAVNSRATSSRDSNQGKVKLKNEVKEEWDSFKEPPIASVAPNRHANVKHEETISSDHLKRERLIKDIFEDDDDDLFSQFSPPPAGHRPNSPPAASSQPPDDDGFDDDAAFNQMLAVIDSQSAVPSKRPAEPASDHQPASSRRKLDTKPFSYILDIYSRLSEPDFPGKATYIVKGFIVSLLGRLEYHDGEKWSLMVRLGDGTASVDCMMSDELLSGSKLIGKTAMECAALRARARDAEEMDVEGQRAKTELLMYLRNLQMKMARFNGLFEVALDLSWNQPMIVNYEEIDEETVRDLQTRISQCYENILC